MDPHSLFFILPQLDHLYIKLKKMTSSDFTILGKKILVGIIVTLVPFIIIFGGLYLTQRLLGGKPSTQIINKN
jgi:hypothetical protein